MNIETLDKIIKYLKITLMILVSALFIMLIVVIIISHKNKAFLRENNYVNPPCGQ